MVLRLMGFCTRLSKCYPGGAFKFLLVMCSIWKCGGEMRQDQRRRLRDIYDSIVQQIVIQQAS